MSFGFKLIWMLFCLKFDVKNVGIIKYVEMVFKGEKMSRRKLTIEYVRKYYENEGYLYLSTTYTNNSTKELVQCPEGHQYEVSFNSFQQGHRCAKCGGVKKYNYEDVKKYYESFGYTYLSKKYTNNSTKELVQCPKGHQYVMSFNSFQQGHRCPDCVGNKKLEYEDVKKYFKERGYSYLSLTYTNNKKKELVQCPKGHQYEVCFSDFKNGGNRCPKCAGNKKYTIEDVRKCYEGFGYLYLSKKYENTRTKELVQCPKGHQYEVSFGNFKAGYRCPFCAAEMTSSKGEKEVGQFVKSLLQHDIDIVLNDRTQILNPLTNCFLELDIWISSMKKGLEFNGTYYHDFFDVKQRDKIKVEECKRLGIDLLIVNEENWRKNQEAEKKVIEQWLKSN